MNLALKRESAAEHVALVLQQLHRLVHAVARVDEVAVVSELGTALRTSLRCV